MLFHRVNAAVPMFGIVLFYFVFLAHFKHVQASTTTPMPTPSLSTSINATGAVLTSTNSNVTYSPMPTTIPTNTIVPVQTSSISTAQPLNTTPKQTEKDTGRKFDGLSFFGGIILGAVICVVLLFSVKYYQAKKRSYHSL